MPQAETIAIHAGANFYESGYAREQGSPGWAQPQTTSQMLSWMAISTALRV
jgi:hypothetical protein